MFDFTVCEQQNLANSLFAETPELEKYQKNWYPDERGGRGPLAPPLNPPLPLVIVLGYQFRNNLRIFMLFVIK